MGVIWGKRNPDFAEFPLVSILGKYRLPSFGLLCWYVTSIVKIPRCEGNSEGEKTRRIGLLTLVALAATSVCAFYTRQLYAFLPIFAAWMVLRRTDTSPFLVLSFFLVAMLPEMFLVYLWKGINPPVSQSATVFHPTMINVLGVGANIGLLAIPLVLGCIRRSLADVLPEWWGARSTVIAFAGLLVFIMALRSTEWPELGGGIIVKAGLRMGAFGTPLILIVSYFGLVAAILLSMRSSTNALLVGSFLVPSLWFAIIPALPGAFSCGALFLFADTPNARTLFNKRVLTYNFLFSAFILQSLSVIMTFSITFPRSRVEKHQPPAPLGFERLNFKWPI